MSLTLDEFEEWFLAKTESELDSAKEDAYGLYEKLRAQTENLRSASSILLDESEESLKRETGGGKYRASRSAKRLARDIMGSLEGMSIPTSTSYNELKVLSNSLTGVISEIASARAEWENQTSPFFLLTMRRIRKEFDRLLELNKEMKEFVSKKYDKARRIEECVNMVGKIRELASEAEIIQRTKRDAHQKVSETEKRIELTDKKLVDLEKTPVAIELQGIEEESKKDNKALHSELEGLRRPLKKMAFLAKKGQLEMRPEATELLKRCEDGIDIHTIEDAGVKTFRILMETMKEALNSNRLSLKKDDRARVAKALNTILNERILEVELEKSQRDRKRMANLLSSEEGNTYQKEKLDLKMEARKMEEEKKEELEELERIEKRLQERETEICVVKARIKENIFDLLGERIEIQ